jgi:hypothetical protein
MTPQHAPNSICPWCSSIVADDFGFCPNCGRGDSEDSPASLRSQTRPDDWTKEGGFCPHCGTRSVRYGHCPSCGVRVYISPGGETRIEVTGQHADEVQAVASQLTTDAAARQDSTRSTSTSVDDSPTKPPPAAGTSNNLSADIRGNVVQAGAIHIHNTLTVRRRDDEHGEGQGKS